MPNLKKGLVEFMMQFINKDFDCFVLTSGSEIQPLCAIYKKSLVLLIKDLFKQNRYSPRAVFDNSRVTYIPLENSRFDESLIANINHFSDMDKLR